MEDVALGAEHPGLEIGDGAMGAWEQPLAGRGALASRPVLIARPAQPDQPSLWRSPAFAVVALTNASSESPEAAARSARRSHPEPWPRTWIATPQSAFSLAPASSTLLEPAEEELVDLDRVLQQLALGATIARRSFYRISHAVS